MTKFSARMAATVALAASLALSQGASESSPSVDDLLAIVTSDKAAEAARMDALGRLSALLWRGDIDATTRLKAIKGVLGLLGDECPAGLTIASLHTLKGLGYEKTVSVVAVACDATERPAEVRLAAIEAISDIGGVAAIPTLFNALRDKDLQVAARADHLLEHVCWKPREEGAEAIRKWHQFFKQERGEKMLVASLVKLRSAVGGVPYPERGLPAHVVRFVLDDEIGDAAWYEAYEYVCACAERRFVEGLKTDRKRATATVREWWESQK